MDTIVHMRLSLLQLTYSHARTAEEAVLRAGQLEEYLFSAAPVEESTAPAPPLRTKGRRKPPEENPSGPSSDLLLS